MSEKIDETEDQSEECLKELQVKATSTHTATNLVPETTSVKNTNLSRIIDITRFSCLAKNIVLTAAEITEARNTWIRNCQIELKQQPNYETLQQQLGVYADIEHILRCKGRLDRASLPDETRYPVLLPRNHHLSTLVVKSCHEKIHHVRWY